MTVDPDTLSSLAQDYARGMTSIRGRRVQRLLKREFAGAEQVWVVSAGSGGAAVFGVSGSGAALCATDGRGRQASVAKWLHGAAHAQESHFDLLKDSLPVLGTQPLPLDVLLRRADLRISADGFPPQARAVLAKALHAAVVPAPALP